MLQFYRYRFEVSGSLCRLSIALPTTLHPPPSFTTLRLTQSCKPPICTTLTSSVTHFIKQEAYEWNSQLRSSLEERNPRETILMYARMRRRGVDADSYTIVFVVKACGLIVPGIHEGRQVHGQVFRMGFGSEIIIQTSLLRLYGLFGDLVGAQQVFDETPRRDTVHWNALIAAYAQRNQPCKAIVFAHAMMNENVRANEKTVVSIVSACSQLKALAQGKIVHGYAIKNLAGFDIFVSNALIDMYAKCGCLSNARMLFGEMRTRNVVSWTSMINAYSDNNYPHEALSLFEEMESAKVRPDEVTVLGVVSACSKLRNSELGEWIDGYVEKSGFGRSTRITNALIDMHCRCGNLERSCRIFEHMPVRTLVSWTVMTQGLAMHGHGVAALLRFSQMQREGLKPDEITFLSIINACSHAGLVVEGRQCFKSMVEEYCLVPWMEHYGSMVDLLCRAGLANEAFEFAVSMPMKPDVVIWRALVGTCRDQGNINLAKQVVDYLIELEPEHSGNYILKSNLHAMNEQWGYVKEVRNAMGIKGVSKKDPAWSYIGECLVGTLELDPGLEPELASRPSRLLHCG